MFKLAKKTALNQISLTGMRAIVMLGLLIIKPRSLDEIRQAFIDLEIMEESHSDDILRIDLNTLKAMGCEISRAAPKTSHKYVLLKHPFEFKINEDEIDVLKRLYKKVRANSDINLLIEYHELFEKISTFVFDVETKEALLGISILKYFDSPFLKDLKFDCDQKRNLTIVYKKPTSKEEDVKEIIAQELVYKNDKLYLHAFDIQKCKSIVLNVKRIKKILERGLATKCVELETTKILFHLRESGIEFLEDNEKIVTTEDDGYLVQGSYYNDFIAMQRILSFGADCTVVEPVEFRNNIIEKIKEMRRTYES